MTARSVVEVLPPALDGERLDRVVALLVDVSRREASALIGDGAVQVNRSVPDKPSLRVAEGDEVSISVPPGSSGLEADPQVPVEVVHEDEVVVVVDKPAGLVVHPGAGVQDQTLVNGLLARYPELVDVGEPDRPGIVHRLDRGTSGLLMVARTESARRDLSAQLAARTVMRRYWTLVEGLVEADEGLIDAPVGKSHGRSNVRAVVADGRPARTRYRVERRFGASERTLLECRLETGRTHQIRAHLTAIGHPVVADTAYRAASDSHLGRPFLHAARLGFEHPETGEELEFSSDLPADLSATLARLDKDE